MNNSRLIVIHFCSVPPKEIMKGTILNCWGVRVDLKTTPVCLAINPIDDCHPVLKIAWIVGGFGIFSDIFNLPKGTGQNSKANEDW